ncbi:MAG: S8 family peptidase, partial [Muribaculaceae bacterium]
MANFQLFTSFSHKLLPLAMMLGSFFVSSAQDYEVNTMANRRGEFVPGELIVKFKDTSSVRMRAPRAVDFRSTTVDAVDQTFRALGVQQVEELMPLTGGAPMRQNVRSFSGSPVPSAPMALAYRVTLSPDANVFDAINQLQALDQVEYAEPNYLVYTLEDKDPDDPYYTNQYGIQDVNLYNLWGMPVLSKEGPVIAILDTGVDITHPDLIDNIWTNTSESDGAYKFDDDGNGFVDDVHGWDFINQTGDIFDYNGHGTHCAGIAAATGYNGKGIIGANPDARIMPVTVMQSNGTGNIATIIKGIDYAAANGAAIISMSLGTYSTSTAFEQALGRAYQKCVLVAAAGNDGYCLNHKHPERGQMFPMPCFPAAYTFVLGVQASKPEGGLAGFSNYDDNGPVFSEYEAQYNYELTVPGASIVSTFPNGQYKYLNGTSMATPLAAGAISRLLQAKEYPNNKDILFGDLIHCTTNKGNTDFYAAYQITDEQRTPELQVTTFAIEDPEGDNDGRPDAGELINIYPTIRNAWGTAKNIRIKLECAETINNVYTPVVDEVDFGWELSAYGSARAANPLQIRLKDEVADSRIIMLKLIVTGDNAATVELPFQITAENGVELSGIISEDLTLYPDVHYIVTSNLAVPEGVTLTILPGTVLKFRDDTGLNVQGDIIANGEPGNMITFMPADGASGVVSDCILGTDFSYGTISYAIFKGFYNWNYFITYGKLNHCVIRDTNLFWSLNSSKLNNCNVYSNYIDYGCISSLFTETNYVDNELNSSIYFPNFGGIDQQGNPRDCNSFNNRDRKFGIFSMNFFSQKVMNITPEQPNYLGSAREDIVQPLVIDIRTGYGFGQYDLSNMRSRPVAQARGIVWK